MTTVRIAHAAPQPGKLPNGGFSTRGHLVVLADDAGHRAVPVWMRGEPGEGNLSELLENRSAGGDIAADVPQELAARLLVAAGASVTGVDIDVTTVDAVELSPEVTAARLGLDGPEGTRQVTAGLGLGLAMAAATGAPVRVADEVLDRVAVPVAGEDLLTPFLDRVPPVARVRPGRGLAGWPEATFPGTRPRFEPRNMDFAGGLDRWELDLSSTGQADYAAATDGPSAVLSSAVPRPGGSAALVQSIFADDYRGATVVFGAEFRTDRLAAQAGLSLAIVRRSWESGRSREDHGISVSGRTDWTRHELTAPIPADADIIQFGITLAGAGRIVLRNPRLGRAEPFRAEPGRAQPDSAEPGRAEPDSGTAEPESR